MRYEGNNLVLEFNDKQLAIIKRFEETIKKGMDFAALSEDEEILEATKTMQSMTTLENLLLSHIQKLLGDLIPMIALMEFHKENEADA